MKDLLDTLLALPEPDFDNFDAVDYTDLTSTETSIEALIRIIEDPESTAELDEETADTVVVHAYRALGARGELRFFDLFISMLRSALLFDDDLYCRDFTDLMTGIGNDAVPGLLAALHEQDETEGLQTSVIMALDALAVEEAARETVLDGYAQYLAGRHPTRDTNAYLAASLGEHRAVDHFPLVRELYERNLINVTITGDLEQAEVQFGLKKSRESKAPNFYKLEIELRFKFRKEQIGPVPASDDPLEIIAYYLRLHATGNSMTSASQVDGFLLACVAAPRLMPPSRYTAYIWDKDGNPDKSPVWESAADAQRFLQALMILHNKTVEDLQDRSFSPVFMVEELEEGSRANYKDWALGAVVGTLLWETDSSNPLLALELVEELLGIASLDPAAIAPGEAIGEAGAARAFALFCQAYTEHRGQSDAQLFYSDRHPYERESPKIGRNDPCPCGSGKKYKKCCMD